MNDGLVTTPTLTHPAHAGAAAIRNAKTLVRMAERVLTA
jgi:hypothetical protein